MPDETIDLNKVGCFLIRNTRQGVTARVYGFSLQMALETIGWIPDDCAYVEISNPFGVKAITFGAKFPKKYYDLLKPMQQGGG